MGKKAKSSGPVAVVQSKRNEDSYEGERLDELLQSIQREIKRARCLNAETLPEKIWLKKQFAIGVNEVTRVLERMTPSEDSARIVNPNYKACTVRLQAILLTADCNPRWLTNHVPSLAISRKVPLILVKDKEGSLRLGELVNLKTAIAIGIKANGSPINQLIGEILQRTT
ncbi:ribonuclease P protein subunit p38 [Cucurbita pepo subsp. pepo]|uniref:ribonuclease P protein subunit p38 n=1 Tax=Cucurbita pepo subsp. pepo TaxID=3664 RepID=UPI000C9D90AA|nr:ribonuclease P protein subunit p38 [Cucurbita pepo subsp. pepo]